jgi:hypothetical protein
MFKSVDQKDIVFGLDIQNAKGDDNFRMNTGMVDTAPLIIWLL